MTAIAEPPMLVTDEPTTAPEPAPADDCAEKAELVGSLANPMLPKFKPDGANLFGI